MSLIITLVILYLSYVVLCLRKEWYSYHAKFDLLNLLVTMIGGILVGMIVCSVKVKDITFSEVTNPNYVTIAGQKYLIEGMNGNDLEDLKKVPSGDVKVFERTGKNLLGIPVSADYEFKK